MTNRDESASAPRTGAPGPPSAPGSSAGAQGADGRFPGDGAPGGEQGRQPAAVRPGDGVTGEEGGRPPAAEPGPGGEPAPPAPPPVPRRSRWGGLWVVLASGAVVLVLLLVFILQNSQRVEVHLYGAHWNAPLGVALLMAAALGLLLVVIPVTGRIIQLRRAARRAHRSAAAGR